MSAATRMKYAGKVDIVRNVNSMLIVGGSNKSVQQVDYMTTQGVGRRALRDVVDQSKRTHERTVWKTKA